MTYPLDQLTSGIIDSDVVKEIFVGDLSIFSESDMEALGEAILSVELDDEVVDPIFAEWAEAVERPVPKIDRSVRRSPDYARMTLLMLGRSSSLTGDRAMRNEPALSMLMISSMTPSKESSAI